MEREDDGDFHVTLASAAGETDTRKWVIVEVTPAWQKKSPTLSGAALHKAAALAETPRAACLTEIQAD